MKGMKIRTIHPDNLVLLRNGYHFEITTIFLREKQTPKNIRDFFITGFRITNDENAFDYPCESRHIGIHKLGLRAEIPEIFQMSR